MVVINFLRTLLIWVIGIGATICMLPVLIVAYIIKPNGDLVHLVGRFWVWVVLKVSGVKVSVKGTENIPDGPVMFAPNHQGAFDIPVTHTYIPKQFKFVAKKELFYIPIFGWSMKMAGYIGIDRANSKNAFESLYDAADKVKKGISILIFPEGTRNPHGDELLKFKRGLFVIAVKSEVPLVPVCIKGSRGRLAKGKFIITPGLVTLEIGKPIETTGKDEAGLMAEVKSSIEEMLKKEF